MVLLSNTCLCSCVHHVCRHWSKW